MNRLSIAALALIACQPGTQNSQTVSPSGPTMWQDYKKLRLVCFWKTTASEKEAKDPVFPAGNRKDSPYEAKEILKQRDISANFFVRITPQVELMVQSLLQDDDRDQAVVTTRVSYADKGFGDNHDISRNMSSHNYIKIETHRGPGDLYVSYACGAYEVPLPDRPAFPADSEPRVPPIR